MKNITNNQHSIDLLHVAEVTITYGAKVKPSDRLEVKSSGMHTRFSSTPGIKTQLNIRKLLNCCYLIEQTKSLELPRFLKVDYPAL